MGFSDIKEGPESSPWVRSIFWSTFVAKCIDKDQLWLFASWDATSGVGTEVVWSAKLESVMPPEGHRTLM